MWLRLAAPASVVILEGYQVVHRRHGGNMSEGYMAKNWLPNLQHREAALNSFLQTCECALPNARDVRRSLFWSLDCEAVGHILLEAIKLANWKP